MRPTCLAVFHRRRLQRLAAAVLFGAVALLGVRPASAEDITFTPLEMNQGNTEANTCMWLRPDLGTVADVLPLKTRVIATQEAVTDKVAMKVIFEKGSTGKLAWELMDGSLKPGSAGLTFYAKASRALKLTVNNIAVDVGTDWKKIDLTWEHLGTTAEKPALGWQLLLNVNTPIEEKTTLILDRIGMESPAFDPHPKIDPSTGPDQQVSSKDIMYGAQNLAPTLARLKAKKPFKLFALGDSITAGAQSCRGSWGIKPEDGVPFLYFSTAARIWETKFGYKGITVEQRGHGGWTAAQALAVVDKDVVDQAGPDDLVILQFGGNDIEAGTTPEQWKLDMEKLIARIKTKTSQILLVTGTPGDKIVAAAPALNKQLQAMVTEDKVGAVDLTKLLLARGEKYSYGCFANLFHPDYCGHIMLGEMVAPILTGDEQFFPGK